MIEINKSDFNPEYRYEGYLWLSNESHPIILRGQVLTADQMDLLFPRRSINPFIVEGYLYSKDHQERSVKIYTADGITRVYQVNLAEYDESRFTEQDFHVDQNRIQGISAIRGVQYWETRPDTLQPDFETEVPAWVAFRGFINDNKSSES